MLSKCVSSAGRRRRAFFEWILILFLTEGGLYGRIRKNPLSGVCDQLPEKNFWQVLGIPARGLCSTKFWPRTGMDLSRWSAFGADAAGLKDPD